MPKVAETDKLTNAAPNKKAPSDGQGFYLMAYPEEALRKINRCSG